MGFESSKPDTSSLYLGPPDIRGEEEYVVVYMLLKLFLKLLLPSSMNKIRLFISCLSDTFLDISFFSVDILLSNYSAFLYI